MYRESVECTMEYRTYRKVPNVQGYQGSTECTEISRKYQVYQDIREKVPSVPGYQGESTKCTRISGGKYQMGQGSKESTQMVSLPQEVPNVQGIREEGTERTRNTEKVPNVTGLFLQYHTVCQICHKHHVWHRFLWDTFPGTRSL